MEDIQSIGESLLPHTRSVAEQVSTQWVMDVRHEDMAKSMHGEDVAQSTDGVEPGSEANVAPTPTEPNVVPPGSEQHVSPSVASTADATRPVQ